MNFEPIAHGWYFEGMCAQGDALWSSDAVQGGVRRHAADGHVDLWLADKRWIGGLTLNQNGNAHPHILFSGISGIGWLDPVTGVSGVLIDSIDGDPIMGVNEMTPDGKGGLYFGTMDIPALERGEPMAPGGLYHLHIDGTVTALRGGIVFPNALAVSPDGRWLYHNETHVGLFAYPLQANGSVGERVSLLEKPDCDGLALDGEGNLWVTGFQSSEILCLAPDGTILRRIPTPANAVTNIRFGGADHRDLFITGVDAETVQALIERRAPERPGSAIYRARSDVAGRPIMPTAFRLD